MWLKRFTEQATVIASVLADVVVPSSLIFFGASPTGRDLLWPTQHA